MGCEGTKKGRREVEALTITLEMGQTAIYSDSMICTKIRIESSRTSYVLTMTRLSKAAITDDLLAQEVFLSYSKKPTKYLGMERSSRG